MKAVLIIMVTFVGHQAMAQKPNTCTTQFKPHQITYNASANANQCLEAVASGILVQTKEVKGFFSLPNKICNHLQERIGDLEVVVEVLYHDEPEEGSELTGQVKKITCKGKVFFDSSKL